jgi:hypothetical protein
MTKSKHEVNIDRELELTVDVMESGVVRLQMTGGKLAAELGPGDKLVLVLRPLKVAEKQPKPVQQETWGNSGKTADGNISHGSWPEDAANWGGAEAAREHPDRDV